ncbi:NTP transferase domain-containing protein [Candidatus Bathyarchaeota archaeon]|nr:NTP transferase domain-containing protein [Candidatus Bathyarchaeota archaeon]
MGITALVMAGGKGTRMKLKTEKPLVNLGNKPIIGYVLQAVKDAKKIDRIIVAVSKHTPRTKSMVKELSVEVLETPGEDYVSDTRYAIKKLGLGTVLVISADLPFVTSEIINNVIMAYEHCGKPALAVMVPRKISRKLGFKINHAFAGKNVLIPSGINVIDGKKIDEAELEQEILVIEKEELAVNVNTIHDLEIAERLLTQMKQGRVITCK